jgi:hypothetical protein
MILFFLMIIYLKLTKIWAKINSYFTNQQKLKSPDFSGLIDYNEENIT